MFKKTICAALSALMCVSAVTAAPGVFAAEADPESEAAANVADFDGEDNITLKVWVPDRAVTLVKDQVDRFKALYSSKNFKKIRVVAKSQSEAAYQIINEGNTDVDVFYSPSDLLNRLVDADSIAAVKFPNEVKNRDVANAVNAATFNGDLYGYPATFDNGYYLVYDKRVVSDEKAESLEDTIEACKNAGKKFLCDTGNGFYSCMFAFTAGVITDGFESDEVTQKFKSYSESDAIKTLQRFAGLIKEYRNTFVSLDVATVAMGFYDGTMGAAFDGVWNRSADEDALGRYFGAAKLPTITVNGQKKQIVPLQGLTFVCVNKKSSYPASAQMLANYLSGELCQKELAQSLGWGPTNKTVKASSTVANDPVMKAMADQSEYACPQTEISPLFWSPMGNLGQKLRLCSDTTDNAYFKYLIKRTVADIRDESFDSFLIGDVNGDGKVSKADSMILTRYIGGWKGYDKNIVNMNAADLNCDGEIKKADSMILTRYVGGWSGYSKYIKYA